VGADPEEDLMPMKPPPPESVPPYVVEQGSDPKWLFALPVALVIFFGWFGYKLVTQPSAPRARERVVSVCNTSLAKACSCVGTTMRWRSENIIECVEDGP
jgi:hypothetical protein